MWYKRLRIHIKKLFAIRLRVSKEDHTPIEFDSYNTNEYYYIVNNNRNNIYTTDELYQLLGKGIDPFTRLPLKSYKFVKVRF